MAVDKAKVKARFKILFPKLNFSQKRMDSIVDKLSAKPEDDADDAAIDEVINDYNDLIDFESLAKDDDRVRKLESEKAKLLKKKPNPNASDDDDDEEEPIPDDTPEWAKSLIKANKELKSEIDSIKTGKITETKRQQAQTAFDSSDVLKNMKPEIKEKWLNRFDLESETSFEDQAKELETEFTELTQLSADSSSYGGPAGGGRKPGEVDQKDVDNVVDKMRI